jgi:hypothetical protein
MCREPFPAASQLPACQEILSILVTSEPPPTEAEGGGPGSAICRKQYHKNEVCEGLCSKLIFPSAVLSLVLCGF